MEPQKASQFLNTIRNVQLDVVDLDTKDRRKSNLSEIVLSQILHRVACLNLEQSKLNELQRFLTHSETNISIIEQRLFDVFFNEAPCILRITYDGKINYGADLNNCVLIDLKAMCFELLNDLEFLNSPLIMEPITSNELRTLKQIRNQDFESVKVIKRNGKLDRIESTQRISPSKRVIDIMKDADFQDIEIKQESGKAVHINRIVKTKLD